MWKLRKGYSYFSLRAGRIVDVPAYPYWSDKKQKPTAGARRCPECGAKIETIRNMKGGWAHFEAGMKHLGTLHPCFTKGRNLSKRRPKEMDDLFESCKSETD